MTRRLLSSFKKLSLVLVLRFLLVYLYERRLFFPGILNFTIPLNVSIIIILFKTPSMEKTT